MTIALLTAAGSGTRMHQDIPKQFIHVDNKPVIIHHIVAKGTIDEKVLLSLRSKKKGQDALMEAVKEIVRETYE